MNAAALSALRDCRLDLLRASVSAAHAQLGLVGAGTAGVRELVGKIDDALSVIGRLLPEAEE